MTLTNVLCNIIITLVTNTVETDNGVKGCGHERGYLMYHTGECTQPKEATEKTVTTTVIQRLEVRTPGIAIGWQAVEGEPIVEQRTVRNEVKHYRRSQEWQEVKDYYIKPGAVLTNMWEPRTNTIPQGGFWHVGPDGSVTFSSKPKGADAK